MSTILEVKGLKKYFPIDSGMLGKSDSYVKAVDDVSFAVEEGETLGIVGESGCGKSTTGRSILRLLEPSGGDVIFQGQNLATLKNDEMRKVRRDLQIVFQDPFASLNPRMTVGKILEEPLKIHKLGGSAAERREKVLEILKIVGLTDYHYNRYPHEFSGGQRQRIGIARALITQPKFIIADEPVSALDVSIQSQILNLMKDLQEQFKLTYMFISHDLSVVRHICDRVGVMYLGRMVELAPKHKMYENPSHPYTQALLSA
ncbi:MAG: ABC transporter ATP-binding protein, partial [Tumebacillaceae bacterium]